MSVRKIFTTDDIILAPELNNGVWRCDTAGRISLSTTAYSTGPLITLHFTRLQDNWNGSISPYQRSSIMYDKKGSKEYWHKDFGVGYLQLVSPGNIFIRGSLYEWLPDKNTDKNIKTFTNIEISDQTCREVPSEKMSKQWETRNTDYMLVTILHNEYAGLIIPYTELLRFYHAASAQLMSILFTARVDLLDKLINLKKSLYLDKDRSIYRIWLRQDIPDIDRAILARAAIEKKAHSAMCKIYSSYMVAREKKGDKNINIRTHFPFTGKTDLKVLGTNYLSPSDGLKYFRVIRLLKCSHPLPWKKLAIARDNSGRTDGLSRSPRIPVAYPSKSKPSKKSKKKTVASVAYMENPSFLNAINKVKRRESRFQEYETIRTPKDIIIYCANHENLLPATKGKKTATGVATWQKTETERLTIDKHDEQHDEQHDEHNSYNFSATSDNLIKALDVFADKHASLNKQKEYTYRILVIPSQKEGNNSVYPLYNIQTRHQEKISWSAYEKNGRARKALLIELVKVEENHHFYLLETERRRTGQEAFSMLVYFREDFSKVGEIMHEEFMLRLANTRFIKYHKTAKAEHSKFTVRPLKHTSTTAEAFGERIKQCVEKAIASAVT